MILDSLPPWVGRVVQLIAFTLVPLLGLTLFGWDWRSVLILYWLENISIGAVNAIRMARARPTAVDRGFRLNGRILPVAGPAATRARVALTLFFLGHYGLFTLVHGVFVLVIVAGGFGIGSSATRGQTGLDGIEWGPALIVWGVATLVQVGVAALGPRSADPLGRLFIAPYGRIVALHGAILGGVFLITRLGWAPIAAVLLIAVHALTDVIHWVVQDRRSAAASPVGAAGAPQPD